MKTLLVQDYLRSGKTFDDLATEHGVYAKVTNGKIALSYDMIEAKQTNLLACECRGLVLEENTYNIAAFPFKRFFNNSEENLIPKEFDWSSARMCEKKDGTLGIVYNYKNKWYIGTRSRCEADVPLEDGHTTFAILFDMAIKDMWCKNQIAFINSQSLSKNIETFMNCFGEKAKDYTFCFEITSPYNRIVCKYDDIKLTLLMVRNNITFLEENPKDWLNDQTDTYGLKVPEEYDFNDTAHMLEIVNSWKPEDHEGVVLVDKNFNRIKVKNIAYCLFNKMRDSLSTSVKGCVEAILLGKDDDLIGMMPAMISDRLTRLKPVIQQVLHQVHLEYEEIKHVENMKEFAGYAELKLWPAALYALKRNKVSDLHTFAVGKMVDGKISSSALETMISLCEKVDPSIKNIKTPIISVEG
jgi:hypothetical protein